MKKLAMWILSASVVIGIGLAVGAVLTPEPVEAIGPCIPGPCPAGAGQQTPTVAGVGANCVAAYEQAITLAILATDSACDRQVLMCNFSFVEETSCTFNNGAYVVTGHGRFACAPCLDVRPCA